MTLSLLLQSQNYHDDNVVFVTMLIRMKPMRIVEKV